jgi:two-component system, NarL family, sensor kinase
MRSGTDIKRAPADLPMLAGRLLQAQDDERRRLALELHDTTAQNLVAALLELDRLHLPRAGPDGKAAALVTSARRLVAQALQEVRTFSYLLYPPLLEELGLLAALRRYTRGFAERSGISVVVHMQRHLRRLPPGVEGALFRVVQEALTNVHRHSGSASAEVRFKQTHDEIVLEIADAGRGIDARGLASLGVGISGMQARLRQIGGALEIRSTVRGTTVRAILPLRAVRRDQRAARIAQPAA